MSLYEQIGGADALTAVVADFYDRVLADDELADFFAGVNMTRLKRLQVEFFTVALGGPQDAYTGAAMAEVHRGLEIGRHHFGLVAAHLSAALSDAGVPADTVTTIIGAIAPLEPDIVTA
jgi:hemoglobin